MHEIEVLKTHCINTFLMICSSNLNSFSTFYLHFLTAAFKIMLRAPCLKWQWENYCAANVASNVLVTLIIFYYLHAYHFLIKWNICTCPQLYVLFIFNQKNICMYIVLIQWYSCYRIKGKILIITSDIMILYKNI